MFRSISLAALALVMLAGCGGQPAAGDRVVAPPATPAAAPLPAPAPSQSPASAVSEPTSGPPDVVAKSAVRMAVSAIETYYADHGSYTTDVAALAAAGFPSTVSVQRVATDGYTLSSTTAGGYTYTFERAGSQTVRRCSPVQQPFCRDGNW